jgi:alcohol dehydrogenase
LHLEKLWSSNVAITTRLVDTESTPMLIKMFAAGKLPAEKMITHRFAFKDMMKAYEVFSAAAETKALKVLVEFSDAGGNDNIKEL